MRRILNIILLCTFLLAEQGVSAQFPNNYSHRAMMDLAMFEVSGSAAYCEGDGGRVVTLSGSEVDMIYQLQRNGIDFGAALTGDGFALSWSNLEEGVYEVAAMEEVDGERVKMDGKAVITRNPLPVTNFGYSYEKSLYIEADSVYGTVDLINFPVLIQINSDSDLASVANGGHVVNSAGYDIAFTDENFLPLTFELTDYNASTGSLEAWVKVPLLSATSDTELHLIYGNNSISSDLSSTDVWSEAYKQVLHMDEDLADASGKGNYGSGDSLDLVSGKISSSRYFDGNNDMMVVQNDTSLEATSTLSTLSLWIRFDNPADGEHQLILCDEDRYSAGQGYEWAVQGNGNHFFYPNGNDNMNYNMGSNPFSSGQWHYLVSTLELESKEVKLYIDGRPLAFFEEFVPVNWTGAATFSSWLWGGNPDRSTRNFAGNMDEIRVQGVLRGQDWIQTEFSNQHTPDAFISFSDERTIAGFDPLCDSTDQITLEQALPAGGSFSGTGVTGLTFDPSQTGAGEYDIIYTYTDANGCSSMNTSSIAVIANPAPSITGEDIVQENAMAEAYSTLEINGHTYAWELISDDASISSGQGESSILVDWGATSGILSVTETDTVYGCIGVSVNYEVLVTSDSIPMDGIIIPEVFTPNLDGWNDRFEIIGLENYPGNMLTIYNVNGITVYQAGDYDSSWDGTSTVGSNAGNLLPTGTYYYVLKLNSDTRMKGFVYLRRE